MSILHELCGTTTGAILEATTVSALLVGVLVLLSIFEKICLLDERVEGPNLAESWPPNGDTDFGQDLTSVYCAPLSVVRLASQAASLALVSDSRVVDYHSNVP